MHFKMPLVSIFSSAIQHYNLDEALNLEPKLLLTRRASHYFTVLVTVYYVWIFSVQKLVYWVITLWSNFLLNFSEL